jgi:alkanesulfonate monooxygenase SsuD/methylene tetrahydromethanopterin reductase-like flavin-dependent oxidoreductase (luciferase family)
MLGQSTLEALRTTATTADAGNLDALFIGDGVLGEAVTLAAAVAACTTRILIGVRSELEGHAHRHPTVLARDMTTLDLLSHGRAVLAFGAPFSQDTTEAAALCRDMWRNGVAASEGPTYPVAGAINRPAPYSSHSPKIALDLTTGHEPNPELLALADIVLVPDHQPPAALELPRHLQVCQILRA